MNLQHFTAIIYLTLLNGDIHKKNAPNTNPPKITKAG